MDPATDRLLVIAVTAVIWKFELLPRWALAVLVAREVLMLILTYGALARGIDLEVRQVGRYAVLIIGLALWVSLILDTVVTEVALYVGLALTLVATVLYIRDGIAAARPPSTSA